MREYERVLVGGWLLCEHNNFNDFELWEFEEYGSLLKVIQENPPEGRTSGEIAKYITKIAKKSKKTVGELTELTSCYTSDTFFYSAYLTVKENARKKLFDGRTRMAYEKWAEQMERLTFQIDNVGKWDEDIGMIDAFFEDFEKLLTESPVYTGITGVDNMLGGLKRGELTTIAARPAVGKSAFALQVAEFIAQSGHKAQFFALEMDKASLVKRLIAKSSSLSFQTLQNPKMLMTKEDYKTLGLATDKIAKLEDTLIISDSVRTIEGIERMIKEKKPEVVFIDQLSLVRTNHRENSIRERFSYITVNLKRMAMQYKIPIVLMCQLRRNANAVPTMDELKESGSIEEDSDNILILHKLDMEEAVDKGFSDLSEDEKIIQFIVEKQRNGITGSIYGLYQGERFRFSTIRR